MYQVVAVDKNNKYYRRPHFKVIFVITESWCSIKFQDRLQGMQNAGFAHFKIVKIKILSGSPFWQNVIFDMKL